MVALAKLEYIVRKPSAYPKKLKDLTKKSQNLFFFIKNWCPQLTWELNETISLKIWIESKQIKTYEYQWCFYRFTSKAYSADILSIHFYLYRLKVPKQLTQKFSIFSKMWYFQKLIFSNFQISNCHIGHVCKKGRMKIGMEQLFPPNYDTQ